MQLQFRGYLKPSHTSRFSAQAIRRNGGRLLSLLTLVIVCLAIGTASIFLPLIGTICWFLASVILTQFWYDDRKSKKSLLGKSVHPERLTEGTITEEGFTYSLTPTQVKWSEFIGYSSDEKQVAVFLSDYVGYIFPREFFANEDDWEQFLRLLESRLSENVGFSNQNRGRAGIEKMIRTEIENKIRRLEK